MRSGVALPLGKVLTWSAFFDGEATTLTRGAVLMVEMEGSWSNCGFPISTNANFCLCDRSTVVSHTPFIEVLMMMPH